MRLVLLIIFLPVALYASRDFVRSSSQYGTLPAGTINGLLNGSAGITIATWYYPATVSGSVDADDFIGAWHAAGTVAINLRSATAGSSTQGVVSGGFRRQSGDVFSGRNGNVTNPVVLGVWNHIAITVSFGNYPQIWQGGTNNNGTTVSSATSGGTFTTSTLAASKDAIGGLTKTTDGTPFNTNRLTNGQLAEFGIWSVELTSAEIASLAAGASPVLIRPQSLVFYAPLGQSSPEPQLFGASIALSNSPAVGTSHPKIFKP